MFSAKLADTSNNIFGTIGRRDDEGFHAACINLRCVCMPCLTNADLGAGFFTHGMSKFCKAYLLAGFRGKRWLVGSAINVKSALSKGLERIKPILFTLKQKRGEHQFHYFEGKGLLAILIPSVLQRLGVMLIVSECMKMLCATVTKINSTSNVELASSGTGDAVNARCSRDRGHANCLSLAPCVSCCQGGKATTFSAWEATPSLDNLYYTILFTARKAEERR